MNKIFTLTLIVVVLILTKSSLVKSQCTFYTIRNGDTFFQIAQQNGISVNDMINANPGVDFNRLQIGQVVCIPGRSIITTQPPIITTQPFPPIITTPLRPIITTPLLITTQPPRPNPNLRCDYTYTLKFGDQCSNIAQLFPGFNTLNPGLNCAFLQQGQRVCIGNNNGFVYNQCKLTTKVRPGESCQMIGFRTGSTMEYLYNCNPTIDLACDNLNAGQTLKI